MPAWNAQCDRFRFPMPAGWREVTGEELRRLSHDEGCQVWAASIVDSEDTPSLVHVTIVPGNLDEYINWLVYQSWGRSADVTRVDGPFLTSVGTVDAALLEYGCLDYDQGDSQDEGVLPRHMRLLLVVAELNGYLYRISLYTGEDDVATRGPEFQEMLDSWLWADLVLADE